jgi:peptidoglycan-associated lipoprotein
MLRQPARVLPLVLVICLLAFIGACGKKKAPAAPPPAPPAPPAPVSMTPPPPPPPQPPSPTVPVPPSAPTEAEIFARMSLSELNSSHPLDDIYFEFDKSDLGQTARASLQKDADWLRKWTSTKVTIEGHADSRGTSEYNLALGERRASAIRDYLATLGVTASRAMVVSKGKEEPVCHEENEACWSKNRRGHFIITAK